MTLHLHHDSTLESGLTLLRVPSRRSTAVHQLVCDHLTAGGDGTGDGTEPQNAYWIDAGNTASTHVLYDVAPGSGRQVLEPLRIARAFTAYQHHSLVREVTARADPTTALIVAPNVGLLYRDADLAGWERDDLLESTVTILAELGRSLECPVLITAAERAPTSTLEHLETAADSMIECTQTREGLRFDGDGLETMGYWHGRYWQTTIPYWVGCCGRLDPDAVLAGVPHRSHQSVADPLERMEMGPEVLA
ncbi:hypothetical protein [Natronosalvus vescus]|uniref:hypothetical protein n=1 Tax=Natronosalvus vescus TaxID=2953881 RepID=UPI002090092B|nr:hypothetical protein [Natronosalvus vescus]